MCPLTSSGEGAHLVLTRAPHAEITALLVFLAAISSVQLCQGSATAGAKSSMKAGFALMCAVVENGYQSSVPLAPLIPIVVPVTDIAIGTVTP